MMVSFLLHKYVLCMKKISQLFSVKKWHASNHSSTVDMACIGQNLSFCYSFLSYILGDTIIFKSFLSSTLV